MFAINKKMILLLEKSRPLASVWQVEASEMMKVGWIISDNGL
jgi:hypothetical protein